MTAFAFYFVLINAATYAAFAYDKAAARGGRQRIPEAALFHAAILGGAAAGLLAMHVHRHKTRKRRFSVGMPLILALLAALAAQWLLTGRGVVEFRL